MKVYNQKKYEEALAQKNKDKILPDRWKKAGYYIPGIPTRSRDEYVGGYLVKDDFSGLGPKNYSPSDERIMERLCEELIHNPYIDASSMEVDVSNGEVTLSGKILDKWMKFDAEDVAENIPGVRKVISKLELINSKMHGESSRERRGNLDKPLAG